MTTIRMLAWLIGALFTGIGLLHVYWALGGRSGGIAAIPEVNGQPLFRPSPLGTIVVALLLFAAAALVLARAAILPPILPAWTTRWGAWGVAVILTLRAVGDFRYVGFFKQHRESRFARLDSRIFSPLSLGLGIGTAIVAFGSPIR